MKKYGTLYIVDEKNLSVVEVREGQYSVGKSSVRGNATPIIIRDPRGYESIYYFGCDIFDDINVAVEKIVPALNDRVRVLEMDYSKCGDRIRDNAQKMKELEWDNAKQNNEQVRITGELFELRDRIAEYSAK